MAASVCLFLPLCQERLLRRGGYLDGFDHEDATVALPPMSPPMRKAHSRNTAASFGAPMSEYAVLMLAPRESHCTTLARRLGSRAWPT